VPGPIGFGGLYLNKGIDVEFPSLDPHPGPLPMGEGERVSCSSSRWEKGVGLVLRLRLTYLTARISFAAIYSKFQR
jgi:hypothetical protein